MDLGFISSILVMFMLVNGLVGKAMDVVFILVRMGVDMLGSLSGVSNMVLAITISEMETHMLGSTLQTKCMDSGFTVLPMGIDMKEPGTREGGKGLECTRLGMERHNLVIGKMVSLISLALKTSIPGLQLLLTILKC